MFVDFDLFKNLEMFALLLIWMHGGCFFGFVMIF